MRSDDRDKPTLEDYPDWYEDEFSVSLMGGDAETWYRDQTSDKVAEIAESCFWKTLRLKLEDWDTAFKRDHEGYPLFESLKQSEDTLETIETKSFDSVIDKSYRWNVRDNKNFPDPPRKGPFTAPDKLSDREADDEQCWFGPHNWLHDFPDIFRTLVVVKYFDGVGFLADRMKQLAQRTTAEDPKTTPHARHDGYHAVHVGTYHNLEVLSYERREFEWIPLQLEVQISTIIQVTINSMLHKIYERWRLEGAPDNWEWQHDHPAFSVNYLGSTLHYLEGMIVTARSQLGGS